MHAWISRKGRGAIWEDEVTSCVFGSLRFLDPQLAWRICRDLFGDQVRQCIQLSAEDVTEVDVRLWPHFAIEAGYVEPDVHIVAKGRDGSVSTILVEVKWGARLGKDQLLRQWLSLPDEENHNADVPQQHTVHVFLYRGRFVDREDVESQRNTATIPWGENGERLVAISWHDLARHADAIKRSGAAFAWPRDLLRFLGSQGIVGFRGFQIVCPVEPTEWQLDSFRSPELHAVDHLNWSL